MVDIERAIELRHQGWTYQHIGDEFQVSRQYIHMLLKQRGQAGRISLSNYGYLRRQQGRIYAEHRRQLVMAARQRRRDKKYNRIRQLRRSKTIKEICQSLGVGQATVYRAMRQHVR